MGFVLPKRASINDPVVRGRQPVPGAPGATASPQIPGKVPDRSTIPGEGELPVEVPATPPRRPLTEYGSAQRIMHVFAPEDGNEDDPARFEQAPISYEEMRKAYPTLRSPLRPKPGYALADGIRASSQKAEELAAADTEAEIEPGT
ncbi:MAG TPA: hypothetical protein VGR22_00965 [Thermomicrobiales bacterium]|nr:hypothetical protein [Thermomicrobiales bacterium]